MCLVAIVVALLHTIQLDSYPSKYMSPILIHSSLDAYFNNALLINHGTSGIGLLATQHCKAGYKLICCSVLLLQPSTCLGADSKL